MTFDHSLEIAASPDELFALTQDYARRLEWDPFLKSAELVGGAAAAGVGVRAYCVARSGLGMETEYVSFNPPRACAVKMTRGPRLIEASPARGDSKKSRRAAPASGSVTICERDRGG
jgi:hypothetical protein